MRVLAGFGLSLLLPSTKIFQKYLGIVGVVGYLAVASFALLLFVRYRHIIVKLASRFTQKQVLWLSLLTFLLILVVFAVLYPIANSGIYGPGSDNDDALNRAASELLHGRYPYYVKTYLGKPISPLPGAVILAVPFVLLESSAYQNLFWLVVFFIAMISHLKDSCSALLLLWTILGLSPIVLYQIVIGSDYVSNSLYVLLFLLWMNTSIPKPAHSSLKKSLSAILLGIGFSSRAIFVFVLPLIFSALVQNAGWKSAIKYTAITGITSLVITIPFYAYDPEGFTPLHSVGYLGPGLVGVVVLLVTGILAVILSLTQFVDSNVLLRKCTVVLALPVLCAIVTHSVLVSGRVDFVYASYGVFFLFFGAASLWNDLFKDVETQSPQIV
jgi:hypothetical protein